MILRTFLTQRGVVNRVVYELPQHEEVHKDTKMRLVMNNDKWYVIAYPLKTGGEGEASINPLLKGKVASSLAEDKHGVIDIAEVDRPVARD